MNRRSFLKGFTIGGIFTPFLSFGKPKPATPAPVVQTQLDDMYEWIESRFILHPIKGKIPFKLTEQQKVILKIIHQNRFVFIIKGRQIGFTSLITAYAAWYKVKINLSTDLFVASCNHACVKNWNERYSWFVDYQLREATWLNDASCFFPTREHLVILDEANYNRKFAEILHQAYQNMKLGLTRLGPVPGKLIVSGTRDREGKLTKAMRSPEYREFKVLEEPVSHFPELWDGERIRTALLSGVPEYELFT